MKKLFLLLSFVAMAATQTFGYDAHKYGDNSYYYQVSPNGKWIAGGEMGEVSICYVADSTVYSYEGSYATGMGNPITNDGMVVGATDDYTPAYWKDGEWVALPLQEGVTRVGYSSGADGVTPDGSVICGSISTAASFSIDNTGTTYLPAVWTRQADGTYSYFEILPHPTTDFTGRAPQYVTARYISDDGCTISGQVMTYDGFYCYPIIYTKDGEGNWSYKTYGLEAIYEYDGEFPKYPSYEPEYPDVEDYMTDEDKAAYEDAMEQYQAGTLENYPLEKDYLSDPSAYNAAMDKYREEYEAYSDSVDTFDEVYYSVVTGSSFEYNNVPLSGNGKYFLQTITMSSDSGDDDFFDDPWGSSSVTTPVLFDVASGEMSMVDASDMLASTVTDDGTIFAISPAMEYTRSAYVVEMGSTEPVAFDKWMATKCEPMVDWMNENMLYDVINYEWNDDLGYYDEVTIPDSLITGSLVANNAGTCFITYVADPATYEYNSFLMDITDPLNPTAIKTVANKQEGELRISAADGTIAAEGMKSFELYDMQGRKMAASTGNLNVNVAKGIYVVKGIAADGSEVSRKVAVGK